MDFLELRRVGDANVQVQLIPLGMLFEGILQAAILLGGVPGTREKNPHLDTALCSTERRSQQWKVRVADGRLFDGYRLLCPIDGIDQFFLRVVGCEEEAGPLDVNGPCLELLWIGSV